MRLKKAKIATKLGIRGLKDVLCENRRFKRPQICGDYDNPPKRSKRRMGAFTCVLGDVGRWATTWISEQSEIEEQFNKNNVGIKFVLKIY